MEANKRHVFKNIIISLLIIVLGLGLMAMLVKIRKRPVRKPHENLGVLVETVPILKENMRVAVHATTTVTPTESVSVIPRVAGAVTYVNPDFEAGSFITEGDVLFKIERADYELAVEMGMADVESKRTALMEAESLARVAVSEWQLGHPGEEPESPLVYHEPQIKSARAALAAAIASLKKNRLDLERTVVRAPFNCSVTDENVAYGQFMNAGTSVARISSTDSVDLFVSIPVEELLWIRVPENTSSDLTGTVLVSFKAGNQLCTWKGTPVRVLNEVENTGRMAQVLVRVVDPYDLNKPHDPGSIRLKEGLFVTVTFTGPVLENVLKIPAEALRDNNTVWLMSEEKLIMRKVDLIRRNQGFYLVDAEINPQEMLIVSPVAGAAPGMKLKAM